jgi:PAS domain-containing protein
MASFSTRPRNAAAVRIGLLCVIYLFFPVPAAKAAEHDEPDFYIDLAAGPVYYRVGFDAGALGQLPDMDTGRWFRRDSFGGGPLIVRELDIPGIPRRGFLSPRRVPEMEFTFLIPFTVDAGDLARREGALPGLFIEGLGDNWELYLNGSLIRAEISLDSSGGIAVHRFLENVFFPFAGDLLLPGQNSIAVRVLGDPSGPYTGFFRTGAFYIGDYSGRQNNRTLRDASVAAALLFTALLFFCLYFFRQKETQHLYYAGFVCAFTLYAAAGTELLYPLIPDTALLLRINYAGLFLSLPLFAFYAETLCYSAGAEKKLFLYMKIYFLFCLVLAALLFVFPVGFGTDVLLLWRITAVPLALFAFVHDLALRYAVNARERVSAAERDRKNTTKIELYLDELAEGPAGNLLLLTAVILAAAGFDGVTALVFKGRPFVTRRAVIISIFGAALMLVRRIVSLLARLDERDRELREAGELAESSKAALERAEERLAQKVRELAAAHTRAVVNDQHYQALFNESRDPLAVLDGNLRFKRANAAALTFLGMDPAELENRNSAATLADRLYHDAPDRAILIEQFWNSVYAFKLNKTPLELDVFALIADRRVNCSLRLEYRLSPDTGFEIFVRGRMQG